MKAENPLVTRRNCCPVAWGEGAGRRILPWFWLG